MTNNNTISFSELCKGILIIIIYLFLPNIVLLPILPFINEPSPFLASILLLTAQAITTIIVILYFAKNIKQEFKEFIKKPEIKKYFKYYVWGYIAMVISNLIINIILFDGGIATNEANNRELLTTMAIYAIPSMVIFAPICEELIFKKSFTKTFSNKYQFTIFTGVLFGSAHLISGGLTLQNLLYIIPYSSLGIAFSYMYIKSNNIFTSITYHCIHNSLTILLLLLTIL